MAQFMSPFASQAYALFRIVIGFLYLQHGSQKLFGIPMEMQQEAPDFIIYLGGPLEFFGGLFVMLGLFTSWAAFLSSGTMAVAYWLAHGTTALLPIQNQGELAVLYCFSFLLISANGGGIWSIDRARGK